MDPAHANDYFKMNKARRILITGFLISVSPPAFSAGQGQAQRDPPSAVSSPVTGSDSIPGEEAFNRSYTEAENLRLSASRKGAEWLKTGEMLRRSTEKAREGNWKEALQLVRKARFQAEMALQQADREAVSWQHRVVGYTDKPQ